MMRLDSTQAVALEYAKEHGRVHALEIAEKLMIGMRFARAALSDLEARKVLGAPDDLGWQKILSLSSEKQKTSRSMNMMNRLFTHEI